MITKALAFLAGIILAAVIHGDVEAADPTNPWLDDSTCTQQEQYYVTIVEWQAGLCSQADVNDKLLQNTFILEQIIARQGFTDGGTLRAWLTDWPCPTAEIDVWPIIPMDWGGLDVGRPNYAHAVWYNAAGVMDVCRLDPVTFWLGVSNQSLTQFIDGFQLWMDGKGTVSKRTAAEIVARFTIQP